MDINVEDCLKGRMGKQGMIGYVIYNADGIFPKLGIPLKRWEKKIMPDNAT